MIRLLAALLVPLGLGLGFSDSPTSPPIADAGPPAVDIARFHDNEVPAGVVEDGVLRLGMRAVEAAWHPYGEDENGATLPYLTITSVNASWRSGSRATQLSI